MSLLQKETFAMKWNNVVKEIITWTFAALSFACGWVLTFMGFYVDPIGEIHPTVIVIFGQAMVITATIIGVNLRFKDQDKHLISKLTAIIHDVAEKKSRDPEEPRLAKEDGE